MINSRKNKKYNKENAITNYDMSQFNGKQSNLNSDC